MTMKGRARFDSKAFALRVRVAMARQNLSLRGLASLIDVDQANIHRVTKRELPPCIETYFRLLEWLEKVEAEEVARLMASVAIDCQEPGS